jgi:hypothetical protein
MTRHPSPEVDAIAGAIVAIMTASIAIRAYQRGRIVVGPRWAQHYVRRNDQPVRFWIAFGGNAAVFVLGLFVALRWVVEWWFRKNG